MLLLRLRKKNQKEPSLVCIDGPTDGNQSRSTGHGTGFDACLEVSRILPTGHKFDRQICNTCFACTAHIEAQTDPRSSLERLTSHTKSWDPNTEQGPNLPCPSAPDVMHRCGRVDLLSCPRPRWSNPGTSLLETTQAFIGSRERRLSSPRIMEKGKNQLETRGCLTREVVPGWLVVLCNLARHPGWQLLRSVDEGPDTSRYGT